MLIKSTTHFIIPFNIYFLFYRSVESTNLEITKTYREVSSQHRSNLTSGTDNFVSALTQTLSDFQTNLGKVF